MVMPLMTKMYKLTGDRMFLDRMYENYLWSDSLMYDAEAQLYYRDAKYIYPKVKTASGGKSFWARGDGWVLAGLAKVLGDMPEDYEHRAFFQKRFRSWHKVWHAARGRKDTGAAACCAKRMLRDRRRAVRHSFAYGLMWGVNHGLLDKTEYAPVIEKSLELSGFYGTPTGWQHRLCAAHWREARPDP